ncbi:MAG: HPF/RaiA family ribosome-associated protein [Planctomycetota bacterium]
MNLVLRSRNFRMAQSIREKVERSIRKALQRFGDRITRLEVSLRNIARPNGKLGKEARCEVHIAHAGTIFVDASGKDYGSTIRKVAEGIGSALDRRRDRGQG